MKLTAKKCEAATREKDGGKLADGGGLYLELHKNGSKYWRYKYRILGVEKLLALGVYPQVTLSEARERHKAARKQVEQNIDPNKAKRQDILHAKLEAQNTFEAVAREWHAHNKDTWSANHANTVMRRMEQDIFPEIGGMPIKEINAPVLLELLRKVEKRGAHEIARRALQMCGQVFRFAIVTGRGDRDVSSDLKGALKPVKRGHYAALEAKELPQFLSVLHSNQARLFPQTRAAIDLLMLTFVRTSELIKARWEEFDLVGQTWYIPAERMKMRQPHIVPLSKQSLEILKHLKEQTGGRDYVFPSMRNPRNHMSNNAILVALDRMGYRGQHTGHGFRALAMSTIKERLGYRHEVVDRQLAHAHKNQVDAAYDRAKFLDDRKRMMQEWADYIDKLALLSQEKVIKDAA